MRKLTLHISLAWKSSLSFSKKIIDLFDHNFKNYWQFSCHLLFSRECLSSEQRYTKIEHSFKLLSTLIKCLRIV